MITELTLVLSPKEASEIDQQKELISAKLGVSPEQINHIGVVRQSIDARKKQVKINVSLKIYIDEVPDEHRSIRQYQKVEQAKSIIVVGSGPAGLFAALRLIELGFKPIVLERGKAVSERKRDLAQINRNGSIPPDSNYAFGEGGAGTFSDGKLYTRSKKRGDVGRILEILTQHGADEKILVDAHPHIGTNLLPRIIQNIRKTITDSGGEVHFNSRMTGLSIEKDVLKGVYVGEKLLEGEAVILATGHSARDVYRMLHKQNVEIEAKDFAMGVRVEHPQTLIDQIQYTCTIRDEYLPAASYSLVVQVKQRGVYSFCMCPGGFIVPAATQDGECVVNGMSASKRDSKFANSGMVVQITQDDLQPYASHGVLAGLEYQQALEHMASEHGGGAQKAPAQRLVDFVEGRLSTDLPECSYHPGIVSSNLHQWLPKSIGSRLREGFKIFGQKMPGYLTNQAVVLGVESRTSSPIRIPRDKIMLSHPQFKNLFPSGEGAGYAGGIVSAAVDGERVAEQIAQIFDK